MNYTMDTLMYGITTNIKVKSYDTEYDVPYAVYMASLKNPPQLIDSFKHTIDLKIDSHRSSSAPIVIYFMHCAALQNKMVSNIHTKIDETKLVDTLAILSWCDDMIFESNAYTTYKSYAIKGIKNATMIVRSIVADNNECVGGIQNRTKLLKETKLSASIPEYMEDWIFLPAPIRGKQTILDKLGRFPKEKISACDGILKLSNHEKIYNEYVEYKHSANDIVNMQYRIYNEIISREIRLLCHDYPEYMKIPDFGPECAQYIYSIISLSDLLLHCKHKPKMTICDVFQYGLAAAYNATYE